MAKNDGGPAFPEPERWADKRKGPYTEDHGYRRPGMSLRDYFAAHADIPWNAVIDTMEMNGVGSYPPTIAEVVEYRAKMKFREADKMLAEREEE